MIGGRVNFSCDDGEIFDAERITCRAGDVGSCEFAPETSTVTGTLPPPAFAFASRIENDIVEEEFARQVEIMGDECENDFMRIAPHPNPQSCHKFYVCMNYNLVVFECDPGFIFSAQQERCVRGNQQTCIAATGTQFQQVMNLLKSLKKQ